MDPLQFDHSAAPVTREGVDATTSVSPPEKGWDHCFEFNVLLEAKEPGGNQEVEKWVEAEHSKGVNGLGGAGWQRRMRGFLLLLVLAAAGSIAPVLAPFGDPYDLSLRGFANNAGFFYGM